MKTLQVLTAAAGIVLAISGPSLAASGKQHVHRGYNAYASGVESVDRSGAYNYGPVGGGKPLLTPLQHNYNPSAGNLPYPDRPYGDPDRW